MGASLRALLRSGVLLLVGLAFGATFVLLGIAGVTLRAQCDGEWGLAGCVPRSHEAALQLEGQIPPASPDLSPQTADGDQAPAKATAWIGETFDQLAAMPERGANAAPTTVPAVGPAPAEDTASMQPALSADPAPAAAGPAVVANRTVVSIPVDASGQPIWPTRSAAAEAAEAQAGASSGDDAVTAYAPVPQVRPPGLGTDAPAAASRDIRRVRDSGVNVRSGPSSRNDTVFILSPGAEVTISDEEGGWLKVTDERGRTGWAYSRYVSNG